MGEHGEYRKLVEAAAQQTRQVAALPHGERMPAQLLTIGEIRTTLQVLLLKLWR